MPNATAFGAIADAGQFLERRALGVIHYLMVEFTADNKVDRRILAQGLFRLHRHRRTHEANLYLRVGFLHHLGHLHVNVKTGRGSEEHQKLIIGRHGDGLFDGNLVGRGIEHFAVGQHAGRVTEPNRIPIAFNFARGRPAAAGAAVESLERRRVEEECTHNLGLFQSTLSESIRLLWRFALISSITVMINSLESATRAIISCTSMAGLPG